MSMTIEERVLNGAALLDERTPGWESKINLDRLNIASTVHCVLGQVYGDFLHGLVNLGQNWKSTNASDHGFSARCEFTDCNCVEQCVRITAAWRAFISARREQALAAHEEFMAVSV